MWKDYRPITGVLLILLVLTDPACSDVHPDPDNTAPSVRLFPTPYSGDTATTFVLAASASDSEDAPSWLWYRWDLDGDRIWDTEYEQYAKKVMRFPLPGYHTVMVEVKDRFGMSDTASTRVETWGVNHELGSMIDPRDHQQYKTVKLGNHWWMAENLNYGTMIRDTQTALNNQVAEKYCYLNDSTIRLNPGGYYTYYAWEEVMDYDSLAITGLCPPGWCIPSKDDWQQLMDHLGYRGIYTYLAGNGLSGFSLTLTGMHVLNQSWDASLANPNLSEWAYFSRDYSKEPYGGKYQHCPWVISSEKSVFLLRFASQEIKKNKAALPVRCIKYDNQ